MRVCYPPFSCVDTSSFDNSSKILEFIPELLQLIGPNIISEGLLRNEIGVDLATLCVNSQLFLQHLLEHAPLGFLASSNFCGCTLQCPFNGLLYCHVSSCGNFLHGGQLSGVW